MTHESLSKVWSLNLEPKPNVSPLQLDDKLVKELLMNRWGAHHVTTMFSIIPESETRIRNEVMVPLYDWMRTYNDHLKGVLVQRGITVPPFPDIPKDWRKEAEIEYKTLEETVCPHLPQEALVEIEHARATTCDKKHHWTSLVASGLVMCDVAVESMAATTATPEGIKHTEGIRGGFHEIMQVLREEVMRIRSNAGQTGWREEEAKEICKAALGKQSN